MIQTTPPILPNTISLGQRAAINANLHATVARAPAFASGVPNLTGVFNPDGHYATYDSNHVDNRIGITGANEGPIVGGDGSGMGTIVSATAHGWVLGLVLYPEGFEHYDIDLGDRSESWGSDRLDALYIAYGNTTIFGAALAFEIAYDAAHPVATDNPPTPPTPPVKPPVPPVNVPPVPTIPPATTPSIYTVTLTETNLTVGITFTDPRHTLAGSLHGNVMPSRTTSEGCGFWFFSPDNPELDIKLLRFNNDTVLVFAAPLTNVEWTLTVTDSTGATVYTKTMPYNQPALVQESFTFKS